MKKHLKILIIFCILSVFSLPAFSQQITKFGVVDTAKVYNAYFRNSAPIRNYEKKKPGEPYLPVSPTENCGKL